MFPSGRKILKPISNAIKTTDIKKNGKNIRIRNLFSPRKKLKIDINIKLAK